MLYTCRYGKLDQNINELTIPKSFVMVYGAFGQRGYNGVPTTWKARIAFTRLHKTQIVLQEVGRLY